jgi:pyruvate/2-oxoglutarate dehydrogenase complex dihydrolipoamide dehydrogenase (E3) component
LTVQKKQGNIKKQDSFEKQGCDVATESARFVGSHDVAVDRKKYTT